jgi:O-antigen/teichoic acid export membrane protein
VSSELTVDGQAHLTARVARSALGLAGRRVAITLLSGLSTAVVARLLGPTEYGQLASAITTWTLVLAASDFGFTLALGRDLAVDAPRRGRFVRAAFQLQSLWSVVLAFSMALMAVATSLDSTRGKALLVLAPSVAFAGLGAARQVFTVLYRQTTAVLIDLAFATVQVGLMIWAAASGLGPIGIAAIVCASYVANTILVALAALRLVDTQRPGASDRRRLLRSVLPLGVIGFLSKAYLMIDLVLLGWLVSGPSLGEYAAASKILGLLSTLPGMIVGAALPAFASHAGSRRDLELIGARVWHWLMVVAVPLFAGVLIFAPAVVTLAIGNDYRGADRLLRVLSLAGVIGIAASYFGTILIAKSIVRPMVMQNAFALVFNVVGNLLLVPRLGVIASAWLTVATEAIVCIGAILLLRGHYGFRDMAGVSKRPAVALVALVAVGIALNAVPAIGIPVCSAVFIGILVALKAWPPELLPSRAAARRLTVAVDERHR